MTPTLIMKKSLIHLQVLINFSQLLFQLGTLNDTIFNTDSDHKKSLTHLQVSINFSQLLFELGTLNGTIFNIRSCFPQNDATNLSQKVLEHLLEVFRCMLDPRSQKNNPDTSQILILSRFLQYFSNSKCKKIFQTILILDFFLWNYCCSIKL